MANRRQFLKNSSLFLLASQTPLRAADTEVLPPWKPGTLDIHHIATARGNSTFFILPDGTTMMVDAGAIYGQTDYLIAPKPDASRRPGEWIGRYVDRQLQAASLPRHIDTFLLTHLHGDHLGYLAPECPASPDKTHKLTGVSDVAPIVPIQRFVDRAWPAYDSPVPATADFQKNYRAFLQSQAASGKQVERFHPGLNTQFKLLRNPAQYPSFEVRNLIANGEVWTGKDNGTRKLFPDLSGMKDADMPSENACSAAIRLRYGKFTYYTGGDLTSDTNYGRDPWRDTETPAAEVCGPVSVAVANHHGYYNATGPAFLRALRPRAVVILAWDSAHPTVNTLAALYSKAIYPGDRDVFATAVKPELKITNKRVADFKSSNGHVVIRVEEGGDRYRIAIVTNADESGRVVGQFGPYLTA